MKVDFHVHSTASDGTFAPAGLAARAAQAGFFAMALTDHDNCDGVAEFVAAPEGRPVKRVAGIELSIDPGEGFDRFHLLGLGIDPASPALQALMRRILDERNARNRRILANFRRLGIEMEHPEGNRPSVFSFAHGKVLARPHFARWLMLGGYVGSVAEAFEKYLLGDSPRATRCYESRWHPEQAAAFEAIHAAGGLAVMAHPKFWRDGWKRAGADYAAAERELARLREAGLDGVEAVYQANTAAENVAFTRMAARLGYLMTAGSDFHGTTKPTVSLGMEVDENYIRPFLEALGLV